MQSSRVLVSNKDLRSHIEFRHFSEDVTLCLGDDDLPKNFCTFILSMNEAIGDQVRHVASLLE